MKRTASIVSKRILERAIGGADTLVRGRPPGRPLSVRNSTTNPCSYQTTDRISGTLEPAAHRKILSTHKNLTFAQDDHKRLVERAASRKANEQS